MATNLLASPRENHLRQAAEILAVLMTTPERDRLDVLAMAVRAAIDSGVVQYFRDDTKGTSDG
jgi:hypothetical protein